MAGASTPELVAAVSNAGALGGFGGTECSPEELREVIREFPKRTGEPYIINLYLNRTDPHVPASERETALKNALRPLHAELNAGEVPDAIELFGEFDGQVAVAIEERVPVLSSHFGAPEPAVMRALKEAGTRVIATATTVEEAEILEAAGIDAIIAQGNEAGGHRGTFASPSAQAQIGTMALLPQIADAVSVPVIAAGGIMDSRGIMASMILGAAGVQMGTAFVPCPETGVNPAYIKRLLEAKAGDAVLTDAFSGRPARLLRNRLIDVLEANSDLKLAFPEQLSMTRGLRATAASISNAEFLPMWSGQARRSPVRCRLVNLSLYSRRARMNSHQLAAEWLFEEETLRKTNLVKGEIQGSTPLIA